MKIGLYDVDSHNFPNLPLMKISAYHKTKGDTVEFITPLEHYDRVYVSKEFGDEYSLLDSFAIQADEIVYGGTGFAMSVKNGKEVYTKTLDLPLPVEIEHIYPDYSLYPQYTENTAYGFLTRGCPNNCPFCIVSQKEGMKSEKVADLSEFWRGQRNIELLDANLPACKDSRNLIEQLAASRASVNFNQGLDARFMTEDIAELLQQVKIKRVHFAFDLMKHEKRIVKGLKIFKKHTKLDERDMIVYMLTNYNTTLKEDLYRVELIRSLGFMPDVRIYRKSTAPQVTKDLQRWCNNRYLFRSCEFYDYVPRSDGRTIKEIYNL